MTRPYSYRPDAQLRQGSAICPNLAAVIVTWRTRETTMELLRYLAASFPTLQVILVECGLEIHKLDPALSRVTVLRQGNLGYAGGNNLGIQEALARQADWILVLNSDVFPLAGSLDELVAALVDDPTAGVAGATLISPGSDGGIELNHGTSFDWCTGSVHPAPAATKPTHVDFCCGAMLLFRPAALRQVGGFDSSLFLFYEEIDWAERARLAGYSVCSAPAARALHLGSRSVAQAPKASTYYRARNRVVVLRRYGTLHGARVSLYREVQFIGRSVAGHFLHGRWTSIWPLLRGTLAGYVARTAWCDRPADALASQVWEARDDRPRRG